MRGELRLARLGIPAALAFGILAGSCAHRGEPFEPVHPSGNDSTKVYGSEYGRWVKKKSPYYVTKSVLVPEGRTLIIEPGVTVVFTKTGQNLAVKGTLLAVGKPDSIILFRPTIALANAPGDWGSIVLSGTHTGNRLSNIRIIYSTNGIEATDVDSLTVEDARIQQTLLSGIDLTRSSITLRNSTISSNGKHGIYLKQCEDPFNSVVIDHCNIGFNALAGIFSTGSTAQVMRSDIMNNGYGAEGRPDVLDSAGGAHFEGRPGIQVPVFTMCNIEKNVPCDLRNMMPDDIMIGADSTYWGCETTIAMNLLSNGPTPDQPNKRNCDFNVRAICDAQDFIVDSSATVRFCWWHDQPWPNFGPYLSCGGNIAFPAPAARWR